jgi:triacylglycerol lipase
MDGQVHTYMIGRNAGHALLDIVRASRQIPFGSLKSDGKVAISGYSEGGGASLWGAQLAASYAPELKVVGAAAGGVPGDLKVTAKKLNGGPFAGFLVDAVLGLHAAYPTLPFDSVLNAKGVQAVKDGRSLCVAGTLAAFVGADIKNFSTQNYTLDQLYTLTDSSGLTWGDAVDAQKLGVNVGGPGSSAKYKIGFPTYQYRGALEEVIPIETEDATRQAYCDAGIKTQWNKSYIGDHILADGQAIKDVTAWLDDRFAGRAAPSNC